MFSKIHASFRSWFHNPNRIRKVDKVFEDGLVFKDIKISSQNKRISVNWKKNYFGSSVFGYENKGKYPIYVPRKNVLKKNMLIYY